MAKNKDDGGDGGEGAAGGDSGGQQPSHPAHPALASQLRQGSERDTHRGAGREGEGEGEGEAGTAGEGGLPTSDPADGGHMAAASQIKRLRLGGSAITAV